MRTRIIPVVLVATVAAFAMVGALATRTAAQNPMGDADAEPAPFNPQRCSSAPGRLRSQPELRPKPIR